MYNNLLSFLFDEVADSATKTTTIILIVAVIAVIAVLVVLCFTTKALNVKVLTYMAVSIALSFALSFIKIKLAVTGGSITLFSMLPILLFSFFFGPLYGLMAGFIYGILQFISDPYIFTYATFFLDYILAYSAVFACGIFKKIIKNDTVALIFGVLAYMVIRLVFAVSSGIFYFNAGWVTEGYPSDNAFVYSLVYNLLYILPDTIITLAGMIALSFTKVFKKMKNGEPIY